MRNKIISTLLFLTLALTMLLPCSVFAEPPTGGGGEGPDNPPAPTLPAYIDGHIGTTVSLEQHYIANGTPGFVREGTFHVKQIRGEFDPATGTFKPADPTFEFDIVRDPDAVEDKGTITYTSLGLTAPEKYQTHYGKGDVLYESGVLYLPGGQYEITQTKAATGYTRGLKAAEGLTPEEKILFTIPYYLDNNASSYQEHLDIRLKVEPILGSLTVTKESTDPAISLAGTTFELKALRKETIKEIDTFARIYQALGSPAEVTVAPTAEQAHLSPYFEATHFDTATGALKEDTVWTKILEGAATQVTFENLPVGYYVLYETAVATGTLPGIGTTPETGLPIKVTLDAAGNTVAEVLETVVNPATGEDPVKKIKAEDIDANGLLNDEIMTYEIEVPLGAPLKDFDSVVAWDILPEGLVFVQPLEWDSSHKALYDAEIDPANPQKITFKPKAGADFKLEEAKLVTFSFKAKVKDETFFNKKLTNTATVEIELNGQHETKTTPPVDTKLPRGHIKITKVDADEKTKTLDGVQFSLYKKTKDPAGEWELVETKTTAGGGIAEWRNLEPRNYNYRLVEDATIDGYKLLSSPIDLVLDNVDVNTVESQEVATISLEQTVENYQEDTNVPDLPNTGTLGALGFAGAGLGAFVVLLIKKRREEKEKI